MRLLGVKATAVWLEQFQTMATLIFISVILGAGLGSALYRAVTALVLSEAVALRPQALLLCVGGLAAVLILAAAVCAWFVARRNLMRSQA